MARMERMRLWLWFRRLMVVGLLCGLLGVLPWLGMRFGARSAVVNVAGAPKRNVALILGAGITADKRPSTVLQRRIDMGVALYKAGKVRKLLMSGDNSDALYDEVTVMKKAAVGAGVAADDVLLDYAGFRTLDSCVRLRKVFGQTEAIVVSQGFHLARSIHLCRWAGVEVVGVEAIDDRGRSFRVVSSVREVSASLQGWVETHWFGRSAKFLGDPIDIDNPPLEALEQPLATAPK
jgi:vancomycin permeability regulator SanA